jgi:hypothetical protein
MMLLVLGIAYVLTNLISHCYILAAGMQGEALRSVLEIDMEKSEGQLIW